MRGLPIPSVLDNQRCAFAPHVQVVTVGSEVLLKNSDPILHTVHARLGGETLFNVGLPKWRQVTKRLDRAGVVRIDCDVLHTWMSAAIVVSDSPYFCRERRNWLVQRRRIAAG
jgi:plastocyanin